MPSGGVHPIAFINLFSKADEVDGSRSRHLSAKLVAVRQTRAKEPSAMEITMIGLDLAKRVFQVHGNDAVGNVVVRKALRRAKFCRSLRSCRRA
jgi:hypothetical protein